MSLTSLQLQQWNQANQVTLYPGKKNRWVWVISQELADTDLRVYQYLKGAVGRVVDPRAFAAFKLVRTATSRLTPQGGAQQTREALPQLPMPFVVPGPVTWAETEFAWHSPVERAPWPAVRFRAGALPVQDPTAAELMLDAAGPPGGASPGKVRSPEGTGWTWKDIAAAGGVSALAYLVIRKVRK